MSETIAMEHIGRMQRELDALRRRIDELEQREPATAVEEKSPSENKLGHFARDSDTSRKAAIANYPESGSQRWQVLVHIANQGARGATREEIGEALRLGGDTVRPRVKELLDGGWIRRDDTLTRRTRAGNDSEVLVLTDHGRSEVWKREPPTVVPSPGSLL